LCLIRALPTVSEHDPQPEPPECFTDPKHVAQLAETQALSIASARSTSTVETQTTVGSASWRQRGLSRTPIGIPSDWFARAKNGAAGIFSPVGHA
jgi:hypothetical protein